MHLVHKLHISFYEFTAKNYLEQIKIFVKVGRKKLIVRNHFLCLKKKIIIFITKRFIVENTNIVNFN